MCSGGGEMRLILSVFVCCINQVIEKREIRNRKKFKEDEELRIENSRVKKSQCYPFKLN